MQMDFFSSAAVTAIPGLVYEREFLSTDEEHTLLATIVTLPLHAARYKNFESRTKIISFGEIHDFTTNTAKPSVQLDHRLAPLRDRVAEWLSIRADQIVQVLVAQYAPGTQLGWHRDVPQYETIAGLSLGSATTLRFRPYPPNPDSNKRIVSLTVEPRSIYRMQREARWGWQHSLPPIRHPRWSITFRTKRGT